MVFVSMRMNPYRCCPIIPRLCTLGSNCEMDDSERQKDRIGESSHPHQECLRGLGDREGRIAYESKHGTHVSVGAPVPVLESHDERTSIKA